MRHAETRVAPLELGLGIAIPAHRATRVSVDSRHAETTKNDRSIDIMAITYQDAITSREFHYGPVPDTRARAKIGAVRCEVYRRNGATQTWKTRPSEYRVPVKYGFKGYGQLLDSDGTRVDGATGAQWWTPDQCPVCNPALMPALEVQRAELARQRAAVDAYWVEVDARLVAGRTDMPVFPSYGLAPSS